MLFSIDYMTIRFIFIWFISFNLWGQMSLKPDKQLIQNIISTSDNDSIRIIKLTSIAGKNRYNKSSLNLIKTADSIGNELSDNFLKANISYAFGNYYFYNGDLDLAEIYLQKAGQLTDAIRHPLLKSDIFISQGAVCRKKGKISEAIDILLQSEKILHTVKNNPANKQQQIILQSKKIILFNTLANFYNQINDYKQAVSYYDLALKKAMAFGNKRNIGVILSNKADLLLKYNHYQQALKILKQAIRYKTEAHAGKGSIANTNRNIALALYKMGQYTSALTYINKAVSHFETSVRINALAESLVIRSNIFHKQNRYQKAIDDAERAKQIALKNNELETIQNAGLALAKAYETAGRYKKALANYKIYHSAKDSIFNGLNIKKITQLEMQYRYDKEQQAQKLLNLAKEKSNRFKINMLFLGLIALLLIIILLYRLYFLRHKSNAVLKEKNEQISNALTINETLLKETHHRVKNNLQIISSLLNMQSKFMKDSASKEAIKDSQNRIKSMSLIHQQLYQKEALTSIETAGYFKNLLESLYTSYGIDPGKVSMDINVESYLIDIDTAIPLGLIVNELVSNAFKHGIDKETGKFGFVFSKLSGHKLLIKVRDNGPGIQQVFDPLKIKSYGLKLIHILSQKLKADLNFRNDNGLEVTLVVSNYKIYSQ